MGEIYSNATGVLIWTGGELDGLSEMKISLSQPVPFDYPHLGILGQLHCRLWLSRGWTIQEAVLAKEAFLIAGTSSLLLEDIELAWACIPDSYMDETMERCRLGRDTFAIVIALRKGNSARRRDYGFHGLLNNFGGVQTSDARDHIYAFLGLNQDPRITIKPSYHASISKTSTSSTRAMIEGT